MERPCQQTLARDCRGAGVGLHSGRHVSVRLRPAPPGAGRYFVRVDLPPEAPAIPAIAANVCQTQLSTELGLGEVRVRTVEHLLAALAGCGVDNARIEIDGPEVPLLDGSARDWCAAIVAAGISPQPEAPALAPRALSAPIWLQDETGDGVVAAFPAPSLQLSYGIEFPTAAIGQQWHDWDPAAADFRTEIAPARTFALATQIESLRQAGLIKGGSLENALVCDERDWLNPPLRFANEPVRHKLLDLVGDLSLAGILPRARVLAYKASHRLHVRLARALAADRFVGSVG